MKILSRTSVTDAETTALWPVYDTVFGDQPDAETWRASVWDKHTARSGFRLAVAYDGDAPVGFAYGYTGERGQWWTDRAFEVLEPETAAAWLGGHFELVSIGVVEGATGRDLGHALMRELTDGLPHDRWLLMTTADEADPARRLYAAEGWQVIGPGVGEGQVIMAKRRPCEDGDMPWTAPDAALPEFPLTGDDRPILEGFLAWHRALLQHKCAGLTGEQLAQRSVPPSNLSLLGLVRHMAKVERRWFRERIAAQELEPMFDPALGADADFEDLDPGRAPDDYERFLEECRLANEALAAASYEDTVTAREDVMSVRSVVIHMIEEYAQHNGHADLLRECIDGTTDK